MLPAVVARPGRRRQRVAPLPCAVVARHPRRRVGRGRGRAGGAAAGAAAAADGGRRWAWRSWCFWGSAVSGAARIPARRCSPAAGVLVSLGSGVLVGVRLGRLAVLRLGRLGRCCGCCALVLLGTRGVRGLGPSTSAAVVRCGLAGGPADGRLERGDPGLDGAAFTGRQVGHRGQVQPQPGQRRLRRPATSPWAIWARVPASLSVQLATRAACAGSCSAPLPPVTAETIPLYGGERVARDGRGDPADGQRGADHDRDRGGPQPVSTARSASTSGTATTRSRAGLRAAGQRARPRWPAAAVEALVDLGGERGEQRADRRRRRRHPVRGGRAGRAASASRATATRSRPPPWSPGPSSRS